MEGATQPMKWVRQAESNLALHLAGKKKKMKKTKKKAKATDHCNQREIITRLRCGQE